MFSRFFIHRPIFAAVISIVIVLAGLVAGRVLPVAHYPEIAPPTVIISANYPGASTETLMRTVAGPIEEQLSGVENLIYFSSTAASNGSLTVTATFEVGTNVDMATVNVNNRVKIAEPRLPDIVRQFGVTVQKRSNDILLVATTTSPDNSRPALFLSNYVLINMLDELKRLPGVGDAQILGAKDYSMRIWLRPDKMAQLGITTADISAAISAQNKQNVAGKIGQEPAQQGQQLVYTVTAKGRLATPEQFGDIVLRSKGPSGTLRLKDVARIELGAANYDANTTLLGKPVASVAIFLQSGANALETAERVRNKLEQLKTRFPSGVDYVIPYDTTKFVNASIHEVVVTLVEAMILVAAVVFLFLQNWRATLIPLLAVPVSLIGTFAVMAAMGLSLNTLSLFGLVLAIGIVVDDAIVVVENVERHIAEGLNAHAATRKAMSEVVGPITATALVLVAVFVPTAFITGVSGAFYKQFALTIAVSTVISAFNSLTLSPALCALMLDRAHHDKDGFTRIFDRLLGWFFVPFNRFFTWVSESYGRLVARLIRLSALVLVGYLGLNGLNVLAFENVPTGFIPQQDQGYLVLYAQLPDAASLSRTQAVMKKAVPIIMETEGVAHVNSYVGWSVLTGANQSNVATMFARLQGFEQRAGKPELHANEVIKQLTQRLAGIEDAHIVVFAPPPVRGMSSVGGFKVQIQDRSNAGVTELEQVAGEMISQANQQPGMGRLFTTFRATVPQLFVDVDRTRAKAMDIPLRDVFETLQIYLGSLYVNDLNAFGRTYQVMAQADAEFRMQPGDITELKTKNTQGGMVPLGAIADVKEIVGPDKITRYNMYPAAEINGSTLPGVSSGQAIDTMNRVLSSELPPGFDFEWTELSLQEVLAGNVALLVFPLSVIFVFLALAAQYESWSLPFAVILIVPMCILSSMLGVWLSHMDNNIFTQIGFIVLVGLASKNAILIVEFAKHRQESGLSAASAVVEAARIRLRPILMTSFAFIMGVFPLVIAQGAGAEARRLLGTAVFSGMIGVTLFGLLLTPVFYVVAQALSARWAASRQRPPAAIDSEDL